MRSLILLSLCALVALPLVGCPADESTETDDASTSEGRGGGGGSRGDLPDAGGGSDEGGGESDASQGGRDIGGGASDSGSSGTTPDASGGTACNASTLDGAINCQVVANRGFVDAYCDCLTDTVYAGDRNACVADQPTDGDFQPDACARAALMRDEAASAANSACYARAVDNLAACVRTCPADDAGYSACFSALNSAFDACDSTLPSVVTDALSACGGGEVVPPSNVAEATARLRAERDAYIGQYCSCAVSAGAYPEVATCRTEGEAQLDPGLSACEQSAFAAQPDAAVPFLSCLADTFTIGASACLECPSSSDPAFELCTDLSFDINFCFSEAPATLQDALIACSP